MHGQRLLDADPSSGRVALAARLALTASSPPLECPIYLEGIDQALEREPPPFDTKRYADLYGEAAEDPRWLAVSLMTNAEREGDGAKRLWSLAACATDPDEARQLKQHAIDESRHALYYLAILDLAFPSMVAPDFRAELNQLSPGFSDTQPLAPIDGSPYAKNPSIDDFLQMNIAEIRTAIHHAMQRPAIGAHVDDGDRRRRIGLLQDALLRDELKHVAYTAALIERHAADAPRDKVLALFARRMHDFNRITTDELGFAAFDCSVACCARHQSCRPTIADGPLFVTLS
jgi:hypothetical protein